MRSAIHLFVNTPTKEVVSLTNINVNASILDLKLEIEIRCAIISELQEILWNHTKLNDDCVFSELGIFNGSVLRVKVREKSLQNLYVSAFDGDFKAVWRTGLEVALVDGNNDAINEALNRMAAVRAFQAAFVACFRNHASQLEELVDKSVADIAMVTKSGRSLLHIAASAGNLRCVGLLLERGLDPNIKDKRGFTALALAARNNHLDCEKEILFHKWNASCGRLKGCVTSKVRRKCDKKPFFPPIEIERVDHVTQHSTNDKSSEILPAIEQKHKSSQSKHQSSALKENLKRTKSAPHTAVNPGSLTTSLDKVSRWIANNNMTSSKNLQCEKHATCHVPRGIESCSRVNPRKDENNPLTTVIFTQQEGDWAVSKDKRSKMKSQDEVLVEENKPLANDIHPQCKIQLSSNKSDQMEPIKSPPDQMQPIKSCSDQILPIKSPPDQIQPIKSPPDQMQPIKSHTPQLKQSNHLKVPSVCTRSESVLSSSPSSLKRQNYNEWCGENPGSADEKLDIKNKLSFEKWLQTKAKEKRKMEKTLNRPGNKAKKTAIYKIASFDEWLAMKKQTRTKSAVSFTTHRQHRIKHGMTFEEWKQWKSETNRKEENTEEEEDKQNKKSAKNLSLSFDAWMKKKLEHIERKKTLLQREKDREKERTEFWKTARIKDPSQRTFDEWLLEKQSQQKYKAKDCSALKVKSFPEDNALIFNMWLAEKFRSEMKNEELKYSRGKRRLSKSLSDLNSNN